MSRGGSADRVIKAAARWQAAQPGVLVLAIDGHGAAGKSTIADAVARATGAALVHTDDFFRPRPTESRPAADTGAMEDYYDWRRLRTQALKPLRARRAATFRRFDWERGRGLDGRVAVEPSDLILVEGVFSGAAELSDLVDRSVFVETPEPERLRRLRRLVTPEEWDEEWLAAERSYFGRSRPPSSFDLVVPGTGPFRQVAGR